jgi:wyosine [tRNA(Phe)-imidazoG37] synthetase (radical SAM superfamily)
MSTLSVHDHSRDVAGYTYVYPVVSRRAGGVSVGINLNPNNACNWACIYCQVPGLVRGNAPTIDTARLQAELRGFLDGVLHGNWLEEHAPEGARVLQDIAFSGNGEPTSAAEFPETVNLVGRLLEELGLLGMIKVRLITNGSLMHREPVLDAVAALSAMNGEVWFKVDRATPRGMAAINQIEAGIAGVKRRLLACAARCPTWIQTCWFALDGAPPQEEEVSAYLELIREVQPFIRGVHLYGIARQPMQPDAERLSALPEAVLSAYGEEIRKLGMPVTVNP